MAIQTETMTKYWIHCDKCNNELTSLMYEGYFESIESALEKMNDADWIFENKKILCSSCIEKRDTIIKWKENNVAPYSSKSGERKFITWEYYLYVFLNTISGTTPEDFAYYDGGFSEEELDEFDDKWKVNMVDNYKDERIAPYQKEDFSKGYITWEAHLKAYKEYTRYYGMGQSAKRIAERGGFREKELDKFYPSWRGYIVTEIFSGEDVFDKYTKEHLDEIAEDFKTIKET